MRHMMRRFCIGVGFAATIYLLIITVGLQEMLPTAMNTFSILITGGCIGLTTVVFDILDKSLLSGLVTHFAITTVLVYLMLMVNQWQFQWQTLVVITMTYAIIWVVMWLVADRDDEQLSE